MNNPERQSFFLFLLSEVLDGKWEFPLLIATSKICSVYYLGFCKPSTIVTMDRGTGRRKKILQRNLQLFTHCSLFTGGEIKFSLRKGGWLETTNHEGNNDDAPKS